MKQFGSFLSTSMLAVLLLMGHAKLTHAQAQDRAMFEVTINITWSEETAPFEFPKGAHMSGIIGATHNTRFVLFEDGQTASSGLELVAENGRVKTLRAELEDIQRRGQLGTMIDGAGLQVVPGEISLQFDTSKDHPRLSFITMLAPSPDWFTGVSSIPLLENDKWIEQKELPLWAWDAGTDTGSTYTAKDEDGQPQESVRLAATRHFLTDEGLVQIGTVTIKRVAP